MYRKIIIALLCFNLNACNQNKSQTLVNIAKAEISIPDLTYNRNAPNFRLANGILLLNDVPYSGIVNDYYDNQNLKSTAEYFEGIKHGYYFGWYANGNKWFERFYFNGNKSGSHLGWHRNQLQMFIYEFDQMGRYHGVVKDWYMNGQLAKHFNFENGKEAGSQKMWEIDGRIKANFFTINGERHGLIGLKNCKGVNSKDKIK